MSATRFEWTIEVAAARGGGQDRAGVWSRAAGLVIALADGAGGTANGAVAAQAVIDAVAAASGEPDWGPLLAELDRDGHRLGRGQTTAVVLTVGAGGVAGASVGDSGAWRIDSAGMVDLTEGQVRKPLVGGGCVPVTVRSGELGGATLLVASDGLLRYAHARDIARIACGPDLAAAARALVERVRLPSGGLQDDVAIVLCRARA